MFSRSAAAALVAALCLPDLHAQLPVPSAPAPADVLAAFHLRAGSVQTLTLPSQSGVPFQVDVVLDGVQRTLFLAPHDLRTDDFQLLVQDEHGIHRLPTPASVTFRGTASGLGDAEVAASLYGGQLRATIHTAATVYGIEPLTERDRNMPRDAHVVYRVSDLRERDVRCGLHLPEQAAATR